MCGEYLVYFRRPLAYLLMLPRALNEYAGSVAASTLFVSNVWFWQTDSYWGEPSALKPLLHTWSLSVEEQFYIIYPLTMIYLWRLGRERLTAVLTVCLILSLLAAQYLSGPHAQLAFFLLPTRAWELLCGALLAVWLDKRQSIGPSRRLASAIQAIGLGLIALSIVYFDKSTRHPSLITLLPVTGTLLLIAFADPRSLLTKALSIEPLVNAGKISYSLYLWHYPVFAFARIAGVQQTNALRLSLIGLTVVLSFCDIRVC
jgi:peptidoglycan/LPS O-acetylase OafA/YrhL